MPLSVFEGREVAETTEYEYNPEGRLIRSTTVRAPEWTGDDRAVLVALAQYRDSLCSCCGLPKDMTLAHERDAPRFVVSRRYCLARKTLIESQLAFTNRGKESKPIHQALQWSVKVEK